MCISRAAACALPSDVQMRKRSEGEAKNVILCAFGGHYDIKQVVVVDEDVDIHDPTRSNGRWRRGSRRIATSW